LQPTEVTVADRKWCRCPVPSSCSKPHCWSSDDDIISCRPP